MFIYTCMHAQTINENREYGFERETIWGDGTQVKERVDVIILQFHKQKKN